jgi:hypothetical protein
MIPPRVKTRALASAGTFVAGALVVLVVLMQADPARAEAAFRKKKTPAPDTTAGEAAPSGGDATDEGEGGEAAAPAAKAEYVPQAEDRDRPHDPNLPNLLSKPAADAAIVKKKKVDEGPPFYTKWQFWVIAGAAAVGLVAAVWGGSKIVHEVSGGDVRPCSAELTMNCFGQGR